MHAALLMAALLGLHAKPCSEGRTHVPALCGTFGVYENRATQSGRVIPIAFVLLKARHPSGHVIYWNPGGPGAPAIPAAPAMPRKPAAPTD
ncbi:MAG TPA: hypothetical protein VMF11_14895 [Candidatus Baltobacteraceae bacterium]|nr:hypothetical protein [Candidatus Baltobacteraceae bacterium]